MSRLVGSLTNRIEENHASPAPVVGGGATILMYSDRHAATVVEIKSPSRVVIQRDKATRTDKNGFSEHQEYSFYPNTAAAKEVVTKRRDGRWKIEKTTTVVRFGERDEYYDHSF